MRLATDERGQAVQVGAVLLFATIIVAMSVYQVQVVPAENADVEYDSYLDGSADVVELRNELLAAADTGSQRGVTVTTGTRYPGRTFFVNPPPASGTVATTDPATLTLGNVTAPAPNLAAFLGGGSLNLSTRSLSLTPDYNEITAQPVVLSHGVVYRAASRPVQLTTQPVVQGNQITLFTVAGDLAATGTDAALTVEPTSTAENTVTVRNDSSGPLTLVLPSALSPSTWRTEILAGQLDPADTYPDRYVRDVTDGPRADTVTLVFERDANYELRTGRVVVQGRADDTSEPAPAAQYVVSGVDRDLSTDDDGRVKLVVEARDTYNNPVSDANVTFFADEFDASETPWEREDGTAIETGNQTTVKTNDAGEAVVWFNATDHLGDVTAEAFLGNTTTATGAQRLEYSVFNTVTSSGSGGSGEQAGRAVVLTDAELPQPQGNNNPQDTVILTLRNRGDNPINVTGYRLDYVTVMASNGGIEDGPDAIVEATFRNASTGSNVRTRTGTATEAKAPYFFGNDPVTLPANSETELVFRFDTTYTLGNKDALFVSDAIYLEGDLTVTVTNHLINN